MSSFRGFRIHQNEDRTIAAKFEDLELSDLTEGEVVIRTEFSTINYKDALAATGKGKILRRYPLVGGIDLAGTVLSSEDERYSEGDAVLICGCGLSEVHDGGYAEVARIPGDCVVPIPAGMTAFDAMAIGTAGFTAAIAVIRMEDNGQVPERGPIIVTGATGGVGSMAINMLSNIGYSVVAFSGKTEFDGYLTELGASEIVNRHSLEMGTRALESSLWGGAVDNVGGETLDWLTRTVKPWGNIASIGLAGGIKLTTTVMPFIIRGVSLLGINSIEMPYSVKAKAWERLNSDLKPNLDLIVREVVEFENLPDAFDQFMSGSIVGRIVVKIA